MPIRIKAAADAKKAEILVYGPIGEDWLGDGTTAEKFDKDLKALGDVSDILVRINSPGGLVFDGVAIYNQLKAHKAQVHVHVEGLAASSASLIAMAGDLITMGTATKMMIHSPWNVAIGNSQDLRKSADVLDQIEEGMIDAYALRSGLSRAEIRDMLHAETWLSPQQAVEKNFADESQQDKQDAAASMLSVGGEAAAWRPFMAQWRRTPSDLITPQDTAVSPLSARADATPKEVSTMPTPANASAQTDIDNAKSEAAQAALKAEKERREKIRSMFVPFADDHAALMSACMDDMNCTPDKASEQLLAALGKGSKPLASPRIESGVDERDKFLACMSNAVLARSHVEKLETGNPYAGISLKRMARVVLHRAGVRNAHDLDGSALASKVFASMTSSDFPLLLANTANKALRTAYDAAPATWRSWCGVGQVSDFKSNSRIQIGTFNSLAVIPEGSEYKQATHSEEAESIQAKTKGRYISLTRQMIINDDLGAFVSRAQRLGFAASRTVNEDAYAALTSNPTMSDTGALFNATVVTTPGGHANQAGAGAAISVASIGAGEAAIAVQKDKDLRTTLNLSPAYLLCPRGKRMGAWEILHSTSDPASSNSNKKNYASSLALEIIADSELDKNSATAWYLVTDPRVAPVIEVDFLDGNETPFIDEQVDFLTDAMLMKVRLDYGVAAIDWRGGYKNPGA